MKLQLILSTRAYKQVRYKIDAAYEMVNTLRKIITKRMNEDQSSSFSPRTNFGGNH